MAKDMSGHANDRLLAYVAEKKVTELAAKEKYKRTLPSCYIYLYHTDEYFVLPQYPESLDDSLGSTFANQTPLARTAPIFAYSHSGPRTIAITLSLHRDMMNDINKNQSNVSYKSDEGEIISLPGDDYVDILAKKLQSVALPVYNSESAEIDPPRVAVRFGNEIFIKGVVDGGVRINYKLPIISVIGVDGTKKEKYARVDISFTVTETTPYDAETVGKLGSFRGVTAGLKAKMGM